MMTLPATLTVTRTPVGMPQVVQMSRQAWAAVPFGMMDGIGRQYLPMPSGRLRQILPFSTVTLMHCAAMRMWPSSIGLISRRFEASA